MKTIPGFSAIWLEAPIDITDSENGMVQLQLTKPITELQKQYTLNYLIAEGFIKVPEQPKDDYTLDPDLGLDDINND